MNNTCFMYLNNTMYFLFFYFFLNGGIISNQVHPSKTISIEMEHKLINEQTNAHSKHQTEPTNSFIVQNLYSNLI